MHRRYLIPLRGHNQKEALAARRSGRKWVRTVQPKSGPHRGGRPPKDREGLTERELLKRFGVLSNPSSLSLWHTLHRRSGRGCGANWESNY
jgi:hypothetical protein